MCQQKNPHVHAELIKAWADGATIQFFKRVSKQWETVANPGWNKDSQYRIEPEPKPDVVYYGEINNKGKVDVWFGSLNNHMDNNLKLTFDGETGKLKAAEVL